MQSHWNSEAGSHETRGEVISVQQDSTRNLIQFSIAFSIKTWNCFPEFNGPLTAQATLVTNHCELTFRKPRRLSYLQIQSDVIFQLFFCYVVNLLSRGRELQYHFSNTWQNHIWKQNQVSIAAICYH